MDPNNHRTMPQNIVKGTYSELVTFIVLNMWPSHLGLPILLAIVLFSKQVQRHPTFINFLITFILTGIASSLLVYTGQFYGPEPPVMYCLFQASLLYGMPAFTSTAVFCLVFQMFTVIRATFKGEEAPKKGSTLRLWILLAAPYIAWLICIIATAWIGAMNPNNVSRNRRFFYCSVESLPLTNTLTVSAAFILLATIVLEVWTAVLFYKRWTNARQRQGNPMKAADLNLPIRILAFGLYLAMCLSLSLLSVKAPQSPIPDLAIATAASVIIVIFGTQPDIISVVCFWRKDPAIPQVEPDMSSTRGKSSWTAIR